jgi:hypothetical protein
MASLERVAAIPCVVTDSYLRHTPDSCTSGSGREEETPLSEAVAV